MYARTTTIRGNPAMVDEGIVYLRDEAMPVLQEMDACVGLSVLVERRTARCIATSAWVDELAMRIGEERVRPMRDQVVQAFGGEPEVQEWEIAVLHRQHPAGEVGGARVTWVRVPPEKVQQVLDGYRTTLLPQLEGLPGFCSLSLLVDRASGRAVGTVIFETPEAVRAVRERERSLRDEFTRAMDAEVEDVAEMDLVLAHLRVPETV